jgi:signal transduction histidine kinase
MPTVVADKLRIGEVIQNLLENAIKFSGEGNEPHIEICATREQDSVLVHFKDNGIGIDTRYHDIVFGLFNRLDSSIPGTGVGLALVKRIEEIHGGQISIESTGDGQGSRFCFSLPTD